MKGSYSAEYLEKFINSVKKIQELFLSNKGFLEELNINYQNYDTKLSEIERKLSFYSEKASNNWIEVAVVGLEKTGKSTLINAIIKKDLLPTDTKRATYTTTQIRWSESMKVEILFYSEKDFLDKVFRVMLADIKYPNANNQNLDSVRREDIKNYFEKLKESSHNLYEKHFSTTKNDIEEIIEGRNTIKAELIDDIKRYDAMDIERCKEYITSPYKSRAVKEIIIYTPELVDIKNLIIYDLPGFDSPTFIHSEFTKNKIKQADAVVFLRDAKRPSLTHPEIEMIQGTREEDGVELKEKLFFFCGKVDNAVSKEEFEKIKKQFSEELDKYELMFKDERIIYGSALARMQILGLDANFNAKIILEKLGLNDGIEALMKSILDYVATERVKILERRISTVINRLMEIISEIKNELSLYVNVSEAFEVDLLGELRSFRHEVKTKIKEQLNAFHQNFKVELQINKEITEKIRKDLKEKIQYDKLLGELDIENIKKKVETSSGTTEERPSSFNTELRKNLYDKINKQFPTLVEEHVKEKIEKLKEQILDIFIDSFGGKFENKTKLAEKIEKEYLNKLNIDFSYEAYGIDKLVERFAGDLIQLLILNPLGVQDRNNKLKEIERELYSLIAYGDDFNSKTPPFNNPLILEIKKHVFFDNTKEKFLNALEKRAPELFKDTRISTIITKLMVAKNQEKILETIKGNPAKDVESIITIINNVIEEDESEGENAQMAKNYDEVIEEIKIDVNILKNMLTDMVLNVVAPEKMIVNKTTRYINSHIIEDIDQGTYLEEFIDNNRKDLFPKKYAELLRKETLANLVKVANGEIENIEENLKERAI
ncbi:MAG: dynamin family protein [Nitrososphaeria archaeon]